MADLETLDIWIWLLPFSFHLLWFQEGICAYIGSVTLILREIDFNYIPDVFYKDA